jgi:hypothetical protein
LVLSVDFTPRASEGPDSLQLDPNKCQVVDAGIFTPGGLLESLPPEHAAEALSAATAGGNIETQSAHRAIIGNVTEALTERVIDSASGEQVTVRPNLEQIAEGIGVLAQAPINPASLSPEQIARLQDTVATSGGLDPQVDRLRTQVDALVGHAEDQAPPPSPVLERVVPVQVTRLSVSPNS